MEKKIKKQKSNTTNKRRYARTEINTKGKQLCPAPENGEWTGGGRPKIK
jgi:hypothetical protein